MAAPAKQAGRRTRKKADHGADQTHTPTHTVLEAEEAHVFATLRIVLDTFERRAIEHFAGGKTPKERARRARQIRKHLFDIIEGPFGVDMCKPPYCYCEGMCVLCTICSVKPKPKNAAE